VPKGWHFRVQSLIQDAVMLGWLREPGLLKRVSYGNERNHRQWKEYRGSERKENEVTIDGKNTEDPKENINLPQSGG
jgi:hypothetical protein